MKAAPGRGSGRLQAPFVLALAGVVAFTSFSCSKTAPPVAAGDVEMRARRGALRDDQLLSGELTARRAVEITAPDVGIRPLQIRWMIESGSVVDAGDVLFEFDNAGLASRLEERRAAVLEARSEIASLESRSGSEVAEAEIELARRRAELDRARIDADAPPELRSNEERQRLLMELRKAERRFADAERLLATARSTSRAGVKKGQLSLDEEEAQLRQVEGGIAQLSVVAPIAGVILVGRNAEQERIWEVGDVVFPGHLLASLPDLSTMIVRARLFDVDDGRVAVGMPAVATLDAYPDLEFPGRVISVDPMAFERDRDSGTRVFWVDVDLDSLDLNLMHPGMSAGVAIRAGLEAGSQSGAVVAPRSSIDMSDPRAPRVLLRDGSWRSVQVGRCSPLDCEIESGLDEGLALGRVGADAAAAAATTGRRAQRSSWVEVEPRDLGRNLPFTGRLRALKVMEYGPPSLARLSEFRITFIAPEGSEVEAGEPILRFDTTDLEQSLRRHLAERDTAARQYERRSKELEAEMNEQELALEEAQAQGRRAQINAEVPAELVARSVREKAVVDLKLARDEAEQRSARIDYLEQRSGAELRVLRDRRDRAAVAAAETERAIELLTVRARSAGTVLHRADRRGQKKKTGATCWRGDRVVEIPEPGELRVDAWVAEPDSAGLVVGLPATVWLDAHTDRRLDAKVVSVQQTVERRTELDDGPIVRLELSLSDPDLDLIKPGMRAHGTIRVEEQAASLAVPVAAVDRGPGGPIVTRKTTFGGSQVQIELGRKRGGWVEVVKGLREGDDVLVER